MSNVIRTQAESAYTQAELLFWDRCGKARLMLQLLSDKLSITDADDRIIEGARMAADSAVRLAVEAGQAVRLAKDVRIQSPKSVTKRCAKIGETV